MMMVENNVNAAAIDRSHFNASHHHLLLQIDAKATIHPQDGMKEKDRIEKLPGQPSYVKFEQYGGYVTINQTTGKAFYYYFAEAQSPTKSRLPLLLWLNGGPGCSSLAFGAMQELGPFRVHSDGKTLYKNKYAWNHAANVLFLESPAGVGFSYSNTTSDTIGGDRQTAKDNLIFLLNWFERFPEYKGRDFYISGESYAGHYAPQLAHVILYNNKNNVHHYINLKGILIGNAEINAETDARGLYTFFAGHALISDVTKDQAFKYCSFSPNVTESEQSAKCIEAVTQTGRDLSQIHIYNIYAPVCFNSNLTDRPRKITGVSIDPCSDYYVIAYLNRADVQEAMHANVTKIPYAWQTCSSDVLTTWEDRPYTVIPILHELMENGLRFWIFSGDIDARVPFTSTIYSINVMNLPIKTFWHPWFVAGEVGGYTQVYEGDLTFATVRGAGHEVPSDQPERALSLAMHFLSGTELPDENTN